MRPWGKRMANKPRPRCPECNGVMDPLFVRRPNGETMKRAGETFYCDEHDVLASGRPKDTLFVR